MFVIKTCPLTQFLQKGALAPMENEALKHGFESFKSTFQAAPTLWTQNWNKPFLIYCDAFRKAMGNTLSQLNENGHNHPIYFATKQITSLEKNYIMTK
jgi:hypothetical protein